MRVIPDILHWQDKGRRQLPQLEELWPTPTRSAACTFTPLLNLCHISKPNFGEREKFNSGFHYYCGLKDTILSFIQFSLFNIHNHIYFHVTESKESKSLPDVLSSCENWSCFWHFWSTDSHRLAMSFFTFIVV